MSTKAPTLELNGGVAHLGDDWPSDAWGRFWSAYPHKVAKLDAQRAFARAQKKRVPWDKFWGALQSYVNKTDDRPWCNPATWLNGGRWDDQPAATNGKPPAITADMIARGDFRRTPR